MKLTRQARIKLNEMIPGTTGTQQGILATEFLETLKQLVPTLPSEARVELTLQPDPLGYGRASFAPLGFTWEEELPAAAEVTH